jgi:hypothetical protein
MSGIFARFGCYLEIVRSDKINGGEQTRISKVSEKLGDC